MKKRTIAIIATAFGSLLGIIAGSSMREKAVLQMAAKVEKFKLNYNILNQWLTIKNNNQRLDQYLIGEGYQKIAIYGMGEIGNRLYEELKNTGIDIKYAIDKNAVCLYSELEVYNPEDELPEVDAIIVTAVFDYESIDAELGNRVDYKIVSLEDILYNI